MQLAANTAGAACCAISGGVCPVAKDALQLSICSASDLLPHMSELLCLLRRSLTTCCVVGISAHAVLSSLEAARLQLGQVLDVMEAAAASSASLPQRFGSISIDTSKIGRLIGAEMLPRCLCFNIIDTLSNTRLTSAPGATRQHTKTRLSL